MIFEQGIPLCILSISPSVPPHLPSSITFPLSRQSSMKTRLSQVLSLYPLMTHKCMQDGERNGMFTVLPHFCPFSHHLSCTLSLSLSIFSQKRAVQSSYYSQCISLFPVVECFLSPTRNSMTGRRLEIRFQFVECMRNLNHYDQRFVWKKGIKKLVSFYSPLIRRHRRHDHFSFSASQVYLCLSCQAYLFFLSLLFPLLCNR